MPVNSVMVRAAALGTLAMLLLAPGACSNRSDGDDEAHIRFHENGAVDCVLGQSERAPLERTVRELELTKDEATRLCVMAATVRHAQWIATRSSAPDATRISQLVDHTVAEGVRGAFRPEKIPGVRAYLVGR